MPKREEKPQSQDLKYSDIEHIISNLKNNDQFINVPKTLLKKEEWGLLTILSLLLAGIFPIYFVNILLISFFTELGHLFTTHVAEEERKKLVEFEKEFRLGYEKEKEDKWQEASDIYEQLVPKYKQNPKIAGIAEQRILWIKEEKLKKEE